MNRNECCNLDSRRNHGHMTLRGAAALCAAILLLLAGCRMGRVADIPAAVVPTVTIEAGTSPVAEGDALQFTVRAAPAPTEDLTVRVSLQESGVMLAAEQPTTVRIAKGRTTATLTVDTMGDDEAEPDSTVTATVSSGTGYQLGSAVSASVIVTDDDDPAPPVVTIAAAAATVAEGMVAEFTVRADPAPATDLVVSVAVTETGNTLPDSAPATVTIGAGSAMATLSVATVDDEADESDSTVTAMLLGAAGYTLGMPVSASVTVRDDDAPLPEPTVTIAAGASVVTGVAAVEFTVQADPAPAADLMVNVTVTVTRDPPPGAPTMTTETVTILAGETTATLRISVEPGSTVSASLNAGDGYSVGSTVAVVVIVEPPPAVTIAPNRTSATEGAALVFTVRADRAPAAELTVNVTVTETGSMLDEVVPEALAIPAGDTEASLTVNTVDDSDVESNSTVTVALAAGTGYALGTPASAAVTVNDNDSSSPRVSIRAVASSVTEGSPVRFRVTATPAPQAELVISVRWTDPGSKLDGTPPPAVTINAGTTSSTLTAGTADNTDDDGDATVTAEVSLPEGSGYILSGASASVTVRDDDGTPDTPVVTISRSDPNSVTEGTAVQFTVTASPAPASNLEVGVTWSETGSMLAASQPASVTVTVLTSGSVTLSAPTVDDADEEDDSTVTAELLSGSGYTVGSPGSASVTVTDNDAGTVPPPTGDLTVWIEDATPDPVAEDGTVRITLSMSRAATGIIRASLDAIDSKCERFNDGVGAAAFVVGRTTASARYDVVCRDDPVSTGSRTVKFDLYDVSGTNDDPVIGTPNEWTVNVTGSEP